MQLRQPRHGYPLQEAAREVSGKTFDGPAPRRILMTADTVGGVWTYAIELARSLGERHVDVALATMGAPLTCDQRAEVNDIRSLEIFEGHFKLEWMNDPWGDVSRAGEWLLSLEGRVEPDLIHLNGYAHGALPWRAPALIVGHSCVLSWWKAVKGEAAPPAWDRYRREVACGLGAADLVITPTNAMLSALEEHYGALAASQVVPNGRCSTFFLPGAKEELVLTAGRIWDEAKNMCALARLAPSLSWPVYIAGEEKHPDGGGSRLGNVHLLGRLPSSTFASWLSRASIYALPARYEPFGLSALEAGMAGCALVLGDIPSLREVWGEAALFVPPNDPEAMKSAIEGLINDGDRRRALAALARERALEFTSQRMAAGYLKAYSDLMAGGTEAQEETTCAS